MASKVRSKLKRAPARKKTPKKAAPRTRGFSPRDCLLNEVPADAREAAQRVADCGGQVIGAYREPLGGNSVLLAVVPIEAVEPTPFQRDLSDAHHKKLSEVIHRIGLFLDPLIAITAPNDGLWTPNGRHRLEAMRRLGAKSIVALVVPKREVAWQILALNTEKAHNLRERSLEAIRIYRGLLEEDASRAEQSFAFYLEEASLITMGICYERNGRFAGGAYNPIVRRLLEFSDKSLRTSLPLHELRADKLFELDKHVAAAIDKLKERGLVSPYLRAFVVARINPLRFMQGDLPSLDSVLKTMIERAQKFNADKIKQSDLASVGGVSDNTET